MGNYNNLEQDFIERTLKLIGQYTDMVRGLAFEDQLNYTLTVNCLLGLIVMPKERVIAWVPKVPLSEENRQNMGLTDTYIDGGIADLKELIKKLRNSIAHFHIEVVSESSDNLIDFIEFKGSGRQPEVVAKFRASEIYPFLQYYSECLLENLRAQRA